jgi:transcriptional regulator with XRE-family HTH domain
MGFKENLRTLRDRTGLSQTDLAKKAGVSLRSYQNWEVGNREPRIQVLPALAHALGVTVDELVADKPKRVPRATPGTPPAEDLEAEAATGPHKPRKPRRGKT